ncbi:hypothetical protein I316_05700 [Kwoniella heveanensis BCC8398]|uniref:Micro-fibrillar-associated protein 1 C-terminal domain-containing protein n=1 Tax=Kwoniella heveanensis BCC8398 TaxID=1296120 RepID=A0A1B9GN81_9TREE|nr:hypothetical protein I316_05700 [Kwoniella heveanensis BCC8398]
MPPPPTGVRPAIISKPMAKPAKIRYFKGKAPEAPRSDSESDSDNEDQQQQINRNKRQESSKDEQRYVAGGAGRLYTPGSGAPAKQGMKVELRDVKVEGGRVLLGGQKPEGVKQEESEEEETDEEESEQDIKPKTAGDEESSEYETDSEEESDSEPEPPKPVFRPVFKPKNARVTTQDKAAAEAEELARREEELREEKKAASKELAGETIRRELAEREAVTVEHTVDDTDGLDPTAEFDAWRARELARLLRDKQAQAARDAEKEEIERRRAMPEEQRLQEDLEHAAKTRAREKGEMGFLQKYYHKGAFHQDDEILNRDYTGATQSAVDMSMLPKVMQVRDFGKASRSKYTHLADQDTTQGGWGQAARPAGPGGLGTTQNGCWNCGGPHLRKDCPNNNVNDANVMAGAGIGPGTSANTAQLGSGTRAWGNGGGGGSYNDRDRDRDRTDDRRSRYRSDRDESDRDRERHRDRDRDRDRGYERDRRDRDRRDDGYGSGRHGDRDGYRDRDRDRDRNGDRGDHRRGDRERSDSPSRRHEDGDRDERRRRDDSDTDARRDSDRHRERKRDGDRYREREGDRDRRR